jgi:hypothetical protein
LNCVGLKTLPTDYDSIQLEQDPSIGELLVSSPDYSKLELDLKTTSLSFLKYYFFYEMLLSHKRN